jgi:hypothetical protein
VTVEERLARLETEVKGQKDWLESIASDVKALRDQANMGKGALMLLLKIGGGLAAIIGAGVWILEKLHILK